MATWANRIEAGLLEAPAGTDEIGAGVQLYSADARQLWDNLAHGVRGLAQLLLGAGGLILSGTAFATGTTMPAGSWLLRDNAGYLLYRLTTGTTALEFVDAAGTLAIYAVPTLRTDDLVDVGDADAAAAAIGGIRFIAQLAASAAPDYGLKLGEGTASGSSFSAFTETAGLRVPTGGLQLVNLGGTQTITGDKTHTGYFISTNGKRRTVRDTKFGPPTGGAYVVGDEWVDLAGARWRYVGSAWLQETVGTALTWSGGGAGDITATGQWNGAALLTGYRVFDGSREWMYDTTGSLNRWRSIQPTRTVFPYYLASTSLMTATLAAAFTMPTPVGDIVIKEWGVLWAPASGSGIDGSNYWTADLKPTGGASLQTLTKNTNGQAAGTWQPTIAAANIYTGIRIDVDFTKTGAPPNIYVPSYLESYDLR